MTSILQTFAAYESHLEHLKSVISNPSNYIASPAANAVPVSTDSLHLATDELKADMATISKAIDAGAETSTHTTEIWGARLPILKTTPEPSATAAEGPLHWILRHTLGSLCITPASGIVPGMVGSFNLTSTAPTTHEFPTGVARSLLTGFTSLRMGPRTTGIKVALTSTPIDGEHTSFALDTSRAPDSATCTFLNPARCGPTAQHGTVALSSVSTEQNPPLSIPVAFTQPYASTPQVVVWLSALDFPTGTKLAVETRAANVTPSGFTLFVTGLMDLPRVANAVSWVAFEAGALVSGTFVMGKGSSYECERRAAEITPESEVFVAFNTFSGPPDGLEWVVEEVEVAEGRLGVKGRSVSKALCSTGVAYIVFPAV